MRKNVTFFFRLYYDVLRVRNFNTNQLIHATGWTEIGASVGQVFTKTGSRNLFKGGLTVKYLAGTADSYLSATNLSGSVAGPGATFTILRNAAVVMNQQIPNSNFYIDGYTDSRGSVAVNKRLSKATAQAVANALIAGGIDKSRIVVKGFGKDNPICDNKTEEGRQCNRRVEVVIRYVSQREEQKSIKIK